MVLEFFLAVKMIPYFISKSVKIPITFSLKVFLFLLPPASAVEVIKWSCLCVCPSVNALAAKMIPYFISKSVKIPITFSLKVFLFLLLPASAVKVLKRSCLGVCPSVNALKAKLFDVW